LNKVIEQLLSVQKLDVEILAVKRLLAAGPAELKRQEDRLEQHRESLAVGTRTAKEAMRVADRKNGEVEAVDDKIKDLGAKLNAARTNKEYEALKTEIAGHNADREILEEEALQQWAVGEERESEAVQEEGKVAALEQELEESRRIFEKEAVALNAKLAEFDEIRKGRITGLPPMWLSSYERLLETQGTPVLAAVVDQYCQGCQMNMSIHDVTRAWKAAEVVKCRSCNRILYAETL
jgi:predicted  nucleic acid-binding Zn-ribbon protein